MKEHRHSQTHHDTPYHTMLPQLSSGRPSSHCSWFSCQLPACRSLAACLPACQSLACVDLEMQVHFSLGHGLLWAVSLPGWPLLSFAVLSAAIETQQRAFCQHFGNARLRDALLSLTPKALWQSPNPPLSWPAARGPRPPGPLAAGPPTARRTAI